MGKGRPKKKEYTLKEKILLVKQAGLGPALAGEADGPEGGEDEMGDLPSRIATVLNIIRSKPLKSTDMLALVMYDIEDNKVRTLIAKYLKEKGCIRIQKSVYIARVEAKRYREMVQTMKEIQECYDNADSIIFVPIPQNTPGSMQVIGKDIQIDSLVNKPNTLIF